MSEQYDDDTPLELYGPEDGGWYTTRIHDWIGLSPLRDSDVRGYLVLRSLVIEKHNNRTRKLTLSILCGLIPGPTDGDRSSESRVRRILTNLSDIGLVSTPEGGPVKTSSRASAKNKPLRIRINDMPKKGYKGWRSTEAKLAALTPGALAEEAETPAPAPGPTPQQQPPEAGSEMNPEEDAGSEMNPRGSVLNPRGSQSNPHLGSDQGERAPHLGSSLGSSLSQSAAAVEGEGRAGEREEEAARDHDAPEQIEAGDGALQVLAAYEEARGAKAVSGTRKSILKAAEELLAGGRPLSWLIDRARELPQYGTDLVKHAEMSKVPFTVKAARKAPSAREVLGLDDPAYVPVERDMDALKAMITNKASI